MEASRGGGKGGGDEGSVVLVSFFSLISIGCYF